MISPGPGIHREADPADLPPASLADCLNIDLNRPYGVARRRMGCRSFPRIDAANPGGHPLYPLGNANWDGTAVVLKLIYDAPNRRVIALVQTAAAASDNTVTVAVYVCLLAAGDGFATAALSGTFTLRKELIPSCELHDGRLFVATGLTDQYANVYIDPATGFARFTSLIASSSTSTTIPVTPTVSIANAGSISAVSTVGYRYAYLFLDPTTGARSAASAASTQTGAFNQKTMSVTLKGVWQQGLSAVGIWTKIEIYRTTDGGGVYRKLAVIDNPGMTNSTTPVSTIFNDNTTDDLLSYMTLPARRGRPPSVLQLLKHGDRMLFAGKSDGPIDFDAVYHSEPYAPLNVDPTFNLTTVRARDGRSICLLFRLLNHAFVVKSDGAIYELADNDPISVFRVDPLLPPGPWDCISPATCVVAEGKAIWLGAEGVVVFDGNQARKVSLPIEDLLIDAGVADVQLLATYTPAAPSGSTNIDIVDANSSGSSKTRNYEILIVADNAGSNGTPIQPIIQSLERFDVHLGPYHPSPYFYGNTSGPADSVNWTSLADSFGNGGLVVPNGGTGYIRVKPPVTGLVSGTNYDVWWRRTDSAGNTSQTKIDWAYSAIPSPVLTTASIRMSRAHAVYVPSRQEYRLYLPSATAGLIDTCWVLDLRTLDADGGPTWTRHAVHCTAACVIDRQALNSGDNPGEIVLMGDKYGCIWASPSGLIDHDSHRVTAYTLNQRIGVCTVAISGSTTCTATNAPGWIAPTTGESGLRGCRVTIREQSTRETYTGIIVGNTTVAFTVAEWFGGRVPSITGTYDYFIGAVESFVDFQPSDMQAAMPGPAPSKVVSDLVVQGAGDETTLSAELRASEQAERPTPASLARMKRKTTTVRCGVRKTWRPIRIRGPFLSVRFGCIDHFSDWQMAGWGVEFDPVGVV